MSSVPPQPETITAMFEGPASAAWQLEPGWYLILTMQTDDGQASVAAVSIEHLGSPSVSEIDDLLQARNELVNGRPMPSLEFRYRWVRDIGQQFERAFRDAMTGEVAAFAWLAAPSRFAGRRRRRPNSDRGPSFYAEIARLYVQMGGSLKGLAEHEHVPESTAKEWVSHATRDGFLNQPGKGRRGARNLTPEARRVLTEEV